MKGVLIFLVASEDIVMSTLQERIITSPRTSHPIKMTQFKGQVGPVKVEMTQSKKTTRPSKKSDIF